MAEGNRRPAFLLGALLVISPWLLVQGWILVGAPTPDHTSMPACPDPTGNCASLAPEGNVRMDATYATVVNANVSEVWAAWEAWQADEGLTSVTESTGDDGGRFGHSVAITPFWRFPDDVVVEFTPTDNNRTELHLYSSSRLGQNDIGVNPDRLAGLHAALLAAEA